MTLPNLLIIGAMKSGSTSLHAYLDKHPDIQMSEPKELDFFSLNENYEKGLAWYSNFFKEGFKYNGESSVSYTKRHLHPAVASRISEHLTEDVKLVYIVRDPIDRFQSNFTDSKTYGHIRSFYSINEFVAQKLEDNPLLKTSMYYYQIEVYLSYFKLENIYFLKTEDLKSRPQETMNLLFDFLGLNHITVESIVQNQSALKTYYSTKYLKLTQSRLVVGIKRILPKKVIASISGSKMVQKVSKNQIDPTIDTLSKQSRTILKKFLNEDMKKFEELTKIEFC